MLSRIMRHPAGLMKKALSRKFLAGAFRPRGPAAGPPPDYWVNRFSNLGIALVAPLPPVPGVDAAAAAIESGPTAPGGDGLLPAQGGKASSFLGMDPRERTGALRPRP